MTTRREVLRASALAGAALVLEALPGGRIVRLVEAAAGGARSPFAPNPWLSIAPDGAVTIAVARGEMGQGVRTSLPMLVAEELDCDWGRVTVATAEPGRRYPNMRTSGSWSIGGGWEPLRRAGASARDMLVRAAAAKWSVPPAECRTESGAVIHDASRRRLAYGALVEAARALEPPAKVALKAPGDWRLVGRPMKRRDGPAIVTGAARYGIDRRLPGMAFASIERGPRLGARVRALDDAAARAVPGVTRVVRVPSGVAVVAADSWSAQRGREALRIEWDAPASPAFDSRRFQRELAEASREGGFVARAEGDADAALAAAATRLEALYEYGFQAHVPLEPMNATAHVTPAGCDLWLGTQAANQVQEAVAARLALAPEAVRVHPELMGGGFGRRLGVDYALEAAEVSRAIGGPVQVLWTRADDLRHGYFQPGSAHRMAGGLDASGRLVAWKHTMAGVPHSAFSEPSPGSEDQARDLMWGGYDNPYALGAARIAHVTLAPPVPTGPWRAVHYPPGLLARECFLDELAQAAGKDPVEFRLALLEGGGDPNRARLARTLRAAAERSGWGAPPPAGRGRGIAANIYDGDTVMTQVAEVSVSASGAVRVHRMVVALDCGRVVNPLGLEGQVESAIAWGLTAALKGEVTFANGLAEQSSYADYPVLSMAEMPAVEVHVLEGDRPPLGIGEQPVAPVAAALHNALFAATGKRLRRSPVRASDLT